MLLLNFNIAQERFAISTQNILEIIPLIPVDHVPHVASCIRGIIQYRGNTIPVIDLSLYLGKQTSESRLSSRIIICQFSAEEKKQTIGLIAEHVTETIQCNEEQLEDNGITDEQSHFLNKICRHQQQTIQIINIENLLPDSIQSQLSTTQI